SDDVYWSADGERFTLTRYSLDGTLERFLGTTTTGDLTPLDLPQATFTEWAPSGESLFVQYPDRVEVHAMDGSARSSSLRAFAGPVHGWTPDGRALLMGRISPTIPAGDALDQFKVWGAGGEYFTGVSRTSLYGTRLELYRCGAGPASSGASTGDPTVPSRLAAIQADPRRFARPVAGAITQFVQGSHTGIDVAAPFGSVIV